MFTQELFRVDQSGCTTMLEGPTREVIVEPFHGGDTWAVVDTLTGEILEASRDQAEVFQAAVVAALGG